MMVVMVMVATISRHHDDGPIPAPTTVMVMVMMVVILCELDIFIRRGDRPRFIDRLQQRRSIRNRLKQVRKGICPQNIGRGRTWNRRRLSSVECSERRHRAQKSSDLFFHIFFSNDFAGTSPGSRQQKYLEMVPAATQAVSGLVSY
jgi:hypothetical protein